MQRSEALARMLDEDLEDTGDGIEDTANPVSLIDFSLNKSTESLGSLSQHTSYSSFGDDEIIRAYNATQEAMNEEQPPASSSSSETSLGKRKASDLSELCSPRFDAFRPHKAARSASAAAGPSTTEDDFFQDNSGPADEPVTINTPICISPIHHLQKIFDAKKLHYGVQYEIARYVSLGTMQHKDIFLPNLYAVAALTSNREAVPATRALIKDVIDTDDLKADDPLKSAFAKEIASKSPWSELDREEEALRKYYLAGLGFDEDGEYLNWYGGQVIFGGKLQDLSSKSDKNPKYKLTLEQAELGPSYMFARRFGSKNFFRLKLTKTAVNTKKSEDLLEYLCRPLILCGGVFRAFFAKESNVFYVKTNEVAKGDTVSEDETIPGQMSFLEFLEWHNSMMANSGQTMAKWTSRFALGLSNSVPGILVHESSILFTDDIISSKGSNMTDGAGKINLWSLKQIYRRLEWDDVPSAIQTRVFGAKGLLVKDRENAEDHSIVWLTPSQRKILFPEGKPIDRAHCIVDVLRSSHAKSPCRLSVETIMCLADNGVPKKVFLDLLENSLKELVEPLLDWDSPDAMMNLWCNVCRLGGVMAARRAREDVGRARVNGYSERDTEEIELEDEDGFTIDETENQSVAWWSDEISGCPSSLEETIMYMLDAGFTPRDSPVLRDKLHKFIKGRVNSYVKTYRIDVPMSATAFLVPDTTGILKPGEVFFKSSRRIFLLPDGTKSDIFVGDVLVTRHPCKLPTDIQKWKSVDRPELHGLTDVIILPTTAERRAADMLAGGDYDGDKGTLTWQPEIVQTFQNAPDHFSEPPSDITSYFAKENIEVAEFMKATESLPVSEKIHEVQKHLLRAVCNTAVVGKYSNFHDIAIYTRGYRDRETIRLAYMFCMTLDGVKTGMTVRPDVFKADAQKYQKRAPEWKEAAEDKPFADISNETNVRRSSKLPRFIMDDIYDETTDRGNRWLKLIQDHFFSQGACKEDEDLSRPFIKAEERAKRWQVEQKNSKLLEEIEEIKRHVEKVYNDHRAEMSSPRKLSKTSPKKGGASFTDLPIEVRQDKIRQLSKTFASYPTPGVFLMSEEEIVSVRASYAYVYDIKQRQQCGLNNFTRFPFDVAMRDLAAMKARARGRFKAVDGDFYDHFNIKHTKTR